MTNRAAGRARQPRVEMTAELAVELLDLLERNDVAVWLEGGWGIDALLERETRVHDDLDVLVRFEDVPALRRLLGGRGYAGGDEDDPLLSFYLVDAKGHQVDVHPFCVTERGDGLYRMESGRDWVYPASAFGGRGRILGREVRCLTPDIQLVCHATGYTLDEAHRRDVLALCERFGLPVPDFRSAD